MIDNRTPKEFALDAIKKNTSVIPVGKDKIPLISWKEYQEKIATEEEIDSWWKTWPEANVGIVTGKVSNISVVDVEKGGDISIFPETLTIQTGGGGWHLYYRYFPISNMTRVFPLTDVRGDGGYVVAPTSTHSSGNKYAVLKPKKMVDFPAELFGEKSKAKISEWKSKYIHPIEEGSRNMDFASIIGAFLNKFPQDDWESIVWPTIVEKNKQQSKPLSAQELRTTFNSIAKKESLNRHSVGDIKDVDIKSSDQEIRINLRLEKSIVCFKITNIISSLMEGRAIVWLEKNKNLTQETSFYLKVKSDSNKEAWARMLGKAYDKKEEKEVYPWTLIVAKVADILEKTIREHKQDFLASETLAKRATWLMEPFIQEDQINTFFGMGSSGKTLMSLYFAVELAKRGIKTLFIDYENDSSSWKDKISKLDKNHSDNLIYFDSEQIPLAEQVDKIKEIIRERNIKLAIVDSASMATGESTSDEKSVVRLMSGLKLLKITVLLIAHQRKNDGEKTPIGSIQFENQARNVWNFKSEVDDFENSILHIACTHTKANNTYLRKEPICYNIEYKEETILVSPEDIKEAFEEKRSIRERIADLLRENPGLTYEKIAEELDISKKTASKNLTVAKNKGFLKNDNGKWSVSF